MGSLQRSPCPLAGLGVGPGKGKEGGEGKGGSPGICPNPELASLIIHRKKAVKCEINIVLINRNHC